MRSRPWANWSGPDHAQIPARIRFHPLMSVMTDNRAGSVFRADVGKDFAAEAREIVSARRVLDHLWRRGRAFLGCEYAILGGAMSWVSERNLVAAITNAGGFGVLAAGSMEPERLDDEIAGASALTGGPFGVNLIILHEKLEQLIDVCAARRISHIVLAGGLPGAAQIARVKATGASVICFAPSLVVARKLIRSGADALILEGMEAGGHIGPVSTNVLAQEILPHLSEVPIFVAGGIGRGEALLGYLDMGADGVQLGTRFACSKESIAHPRFKQAFIRAGSRDAMASVQVDQRFPVAPVRALVNQATQRFIETQRSVVQRFNEGALTQKEAQLEIEHFWAGALRAAVFEGDIDNGSLMAGQSVGMVSGELSVREIIAELAGQAVEGILRRRAVEAEAAARFEASHEAKYEAEFEDGRKAGP